MPEHFFIAGAQRSGSTYLYHVCDEHPEIEMAKPVRPEPKFFLMDDLYARGLAYYHDHLFEGKPGVKLLGEKSVSYIEWEKAARRIAESFPTAKLVFILRDPVERAVSNYWFSVNNGLERLPMAEAFMREEERWRDFDPEKISASPFAYLRRGRYITYITMYERYFPAENMEIVLYEQFTGSAEAVRGLYTFLGVATDFSPPSLDRVINKGERDGTVLPPEVEDYLVDYFAEPNARLAEHLGRPLTPWRRP
jgi:hypothetical protein